MTAAAVPETSVMHTAGPMQQGIQRCAVCSVLLADETGSDVRVVRPGSTAWTRGARVLVLTGADYAIAGPYPEDARMPSGTRQCTPPNPSTKDRP